MTADVMNHLAVVFEVALRVVLAVVVTGGIVIVVATWMQNNPTLQNRRQQAAMVATRNQIARERAALNANAQIQKKHYR